MRGEGTAGRERGRTGAGGGTGSNDSKEVSERMAAEARAAEHPAGGGNAGSGVRHGHGGEGHGDHGPGDHEGGGHASVGFYWMIGGILAVLTAMEVAAFYMELGAVEAPFLLALSAAKFVLVVMFFMHLRFDSRVLTGLFMAGMVLAMFVVSAIYVLYQVLPNYGV